MGGEDGGMESSTSSGDVKLQDSSVSSTNIFARSDPVGRKNIKRAMGKLMPMMKHAAYLSSKFSDAIMNLPLRFGCYGITEVSKEMVFQQVQMFLSPTVLGATLG